MIARDVAQALYRKWPASEYLSIDEASETADRRAGRLDRLVLSLWESRGFELDGVEIKVSLSDWRRELNRAAKADWWWHHVHRFWVAAPEDLAAKIRAEIPEGWGLLSITDAACKTLVKPARHTPEPLPWTTVLGLLRGAADAGLFALAAASRAGIAEGRKLEEANSTSGRNEDILRRDYDKLRERVKTFETESGISIDKTWDLSTCARAVAFVEKATRTPDMVSRIELACIHAEHLLTQARALKDDITAIVDTSAPPTLAPPSQSVL